MNHLIEREPVMQDAELKIGGDRFRIRIGDGDFDMIKAACSRVNRARPVSEFHSANMALTGIASAFGGFTIAALLADAGVLKCTSM